MPVSKSTTSQTAEPSSRDWHHVPPLPIENSPLFAWPLQPVKIFRWFGVSWLKLSEQMVFALVAIGIWLFVQPPLEDCKSFEIGWIAGVYLRNLILMIVLAGGLQ